MGLIPLVILNIYIFFFDMKKFSKMTTSLHVNSLKPVCLLSFKCLLVK